MNLAIKDVRHNAGRFSLTAIGIGMLLMIVMGMGGIYRGLIEDATLLIEKIGADLWIVQAETKGPFAELSRIPVNIVERVFAVPGIKSAGQFVYHTIQRSHADRSLRIAVLGLDWPKDNGAWLPLFAGRSLAQAHFEMIADKTLGLSIGEKLRLGKNIYTVVGITEGMVASGGDGLAFFTISDSQAIQFDKAGESIRLERESRKARADTDDLFRSRPIIMDRTSGQTSSIPVIVPPSISAIVATLKPGKDISTVTSIITGWDDVSVYNREQQRQFMLKGTVEMSKKQIGLFTVLLTGISAIIMALILYTLTMEKQHDIALLKLIGAPDSVILGMVLQQALLLGGVGYCIAYVFGLNLFPYFPRRVILLNQDLLLLGGVVIIVSVFSSLLAILKAMSINPNEVLSG